MPLIAHSDLPSFQRLRTEGQEVLSQSKAQHQDIRELHIGILNMMPDAALQATERQFLRMVGSCNRIAQFYVHLFTFDEIPRGEAAKAHIEQYYDSFDKIKQEGLDALIITGANPQKADLTEEPFWQPLQQVVTWAQQNVSSVMCSCLATHAVVEMLYGIKRYPLPRKRWGVYSHRVCDVLHPLVSNINSRFDAPHSHVYEVNSKQFEEKGLRVLARGEESGLHLGTSADGFRFVFFQGHPEYDGISLLKEYKRELVRYLEGVNPTYPRMPQHYFNKTAKSVLIDYEKRIAQAAGDYTNLPPFPDQELIDLVDNTWSDTGKAIVNNWLGLVYQFTGKGRHQIFMSGIDASDPIGLLQITNRDK